jgi:prophage DNA circulation protein
MSFVDDLRTVTHPDGRELVGGSFRGVPFFVEARDLQTGRRLVIHEFPFRSEPVVQDLGRRSRPYTFEAYAIGPDYVAAKEALLEALEAPGAGELIDPYTRRRIRAHCGAVTLRESRAEGGIARFSLEFIEVSSAAIAPEVTPDLPAAVVASADAGQVAMQAQLDADYDASPTVAPAFTLESLAADVEGLATTMDAVLKPLVTTSQQLAAIDVQLQAMVSDAISLVRSPADTTAAFFEVIGSIADTIESAPRDVALALLDAYDVPTQPAAIGTTAARERERANQEALGEALRQLLVIESARILPAIEYETEEDAISDRDAVASRIDEQALVAGDTIFPALLQLRADVFRAIPGDLQLARIVTIERRTALPALVLSYQLYGHVDAEEDILARNPVQHPSFVSGTLSVLSDV